MREVRSKKDKIKIHSNDESPGFYSFSNKEPDFENITDNYLSRLFKYIPTEIIGVFIVTDSILKSQEYYNVILGLIVFVTLLIITPVYLFKVQQVTKYSQLVISSLCFVVWSFSIGGPFVAASWYDPIQSALLLPVFTLLISLYEA